MPTDVVLRKNERLVDLELKSLKIIQNSKEYCFSEEPVLLSDFMQVSPTDAILDVGCGNGIIPILLCGKYETGKIYGCEIQKYLADMSKRSIEYNGLQDRIEILNEDFKRLPDVFGRGYFDVIVSNPPYKKAGTGRYNPDSTKTIAKQDFHFKLEDFVRISAGLLKKDGRLYVVFPQERREEFLFTLEEYGFMLTRSFLGISTKKKKIEFFEAVKRASK